MRKTKLFLADDHAVLRAGLKMLLNNEPDFKVVDEAADGESVLAKLAQTDADVLIIDLSMPTMNGLECINEIASRGHKIPILVLTMHEDDSYMKKAMQAGALGYVKKNTVDTELFTAIRTVAKGQRYLSPRDSQQLLHSLLSGSEQVRTPDNPYTVLSAREREVLKLLARGYSINQIAENLMLSIKTVDTYKTRLMRKLNCTYKNQLVEYALKYNFLTAPSE